MANEQESAELRELLRSDIDQQADNIDQFPERSDGEGVVRETHDEPISTTASRARSGSCEQNALEPRGSYVTEPESDVSDSSEEDELRQAEDLDHKDIPETLKNVLDGKGGNIDDISEVLTPKALTTDCHENALKTAMKASYQLRKLARKKGPSEEDFANVAHSVELFSFSLLDPLKSNDAARHVLGDSMDDILDSAINWEQKRLLSHPVIFNLMADKWLGQFGKLRSSSIVVERLQWLFLNVWCLFDSFMFPVLFALFWASNKIFGDNQKLKTRGIEVAFLINATSDLAQETFMLMKDTVQRFIEEHGDEQTKYQIIIHDKKSKKQYYDEKRSNLRCFDDPSSYSTDTRPRESKPKEVDAENVKDLENGNAKFPALHRDLDMADKYFFAETRESPVDKVIIYLTDHKTSLGPKIKKVKQRARDLAEKREIKLLPVGVGPYTDIRELKKVTKENNQDLNVIHVGEYESPDTIRKIIWGELHGKCVYESYWDYFTTPYFVFVRDTVSYFALVALHFAICLSPSTVPLSGLEWAILVFFLGRILMEIQQITTIKKRENENGCTQRSTTGKYLSDAWNVLDFITLVIYLLTFFLRTIAWGLSTSTINNRAIVVAGYFYGVNTMLLTLRSFGQVMETSKGVGVVQIALFQMFGDVTTIFWQFIAAILAFSIAITKVYMAERSYISKANNITQGLVCETPGMSCWWTMMKHLCWSLLGLAELDPLDSIDHTSVTIAHFLFGVFLVLGVILLVNMMIALLNNTYEKVQDNALREWSFRKAITLQTYSDYHPIPVPFNIISWCWSLLCGKCCEGCIRDCRGYQGDSCSEKKKKSFNLVVTNLQKAYFAKYGNCLPVTDDGKRIDQIFEETKQSKKFANQISYETFLLSAFNQGALPVGQKAWDSSGITVDGCLLTYQGKEICEICKKYGPMIYHGARYRVPFSPKYPHFKVLIQESVRSVGVGVVWQFYGNHAMPGWKDDTVGYIVNQGKVFGPCLPVNPERGLEYENAVAYRGDVIGCTVEFGDEENPVEVEIVFTLNGKPITQDKIRMPYTLDFCEGFSTKMYPYVCMTTCGTTVLAKMCSTKNGQIETEGTKPITQVTSKIDETVNSEFKAADEVVQRFQKALFNSLTEVDEFMNDVTRRLEVLEHLLVPSPLKEDDEAAIVINNPRSSECTQVVCDYLFETEHLQFLDGLGDLQPTTDPSKKICDDLEKVDNTTKETFELLLKSLKNLEDKFQGKTVENKKKRGKIQGKLQELRDLIMNRNFSNSVQ